MKPALYLEAIGSQPGHDDDHVLVSLETLIVLNVLSFVENASDVDIFLITTSGLAAPSEPCVRLPRRSVNARIQTEATFAANIASKMTFPIMKMDAWVYVAGLCSVCRSIIKHAGQSKEYLLGFKQSCLSAPAEVSPWTKFCEIDVIQGARLTLSFHDQLPAGHTQFGLPDVLACLESHLSQAPRQHNKAGHSKRRTADAAKTMEQMAKQMAAVALNADESGSIATGTVLSEDEPSRPQFMEGDTISIADLVVFPCIWIMITTMRAYDSMKIEKWLPLSCAWTERVRGAYQSVDMTSPVPRPIAQTTVEYTLAAVSGFSLYKREPKGQRAKSRKFTKQLELDQAIRKVDAMNVSAAAAAASVNATDNGNAAHSRAWSHIPVNVLPEPAEIPESRLDRKREQLLCLAREVAELTARGDVIVDFCSGAGHLGILIAHQLPECFVILLENKEESAQRAKQRVECIGLRNIAIFQCNIDYLCGRFDVGTSLHACGVATDIVIMQCVRRRAAFVSCPCCYGGCVETADIAYPRSKLYRAHGITADDYKYLSHAADQAHELTKTQNADKSLQGMACMDYVDTDRKAYAEECGYRVRLTRLYPENCTPKNRLLIGTFDNKSV